MNHEGNKMKAVEERYSQELKEWRATLGERKQVSFSVDWKEEEGCVMASSGFISRFT